MAELVYSGVFGSTLRVLYREFADGLARPAFAQELTYDLASSREIRFRSVVIEVVEASNSHIRFRVVEDGNLAWLPR